jgi:formylglycine-generating enzyme required for sulfatase activity
LDDLLEDDLDDLLEALPFRLPSEAEWEYAAWAGHHTDLPR